MSVPGLRLRAGWPDAGYSQRALRAGDGPIIFADPLNARLLPRNGITSPFLLASRRRNTNASFKPHFKHAVIVFRPSQSNAYDLQISDKNKPVASIKLRVGTIDYF